VEAIYMDPQQRLFLEESWKALEDAGYTGSGIQGCRCGVYVGCSSGDYQKIAVTDPPPQSFWGNANSVIPARIAYYLNLHGPAVAIDTACSSSLVAIHLACQGLWTGETAMALAGGVYVQCTEGLYITGNRAGMLSPRGHCYAFDERADGFVPGEGVGVIVLKRLRDAISDGDHIYGVIKGSGINQDGATNGITAPSGLSQERLECQVYDTFGINPERITMVEAHGTGTKLGDPIEYQALTYAFRKYTDHKGYCALGSIKTNIGHTATAAGVAGVIKVLLALEAGQIPPSLHFRTGNPNIPFADSPFYVNTGLTDWQSRPGTAPRCAAVSSFGFSGTNAHIVIEEAPRVERRHAEKPGYLIGLSARTAEQLRRQAEQLAEYCAANPAVDCGNISYTLLLGRKHLNHRLACVVRDSRELRLALRQWLETGTEGSVHVCEISENEQREQRSLKHYGNSCIRNCRDNSPAPDAYREHLETVADLYAQGYGLEYERLFANDHYTRLALPTYPFARERYWVPERHSRAGVAAEPAAAGLHPLVHRNTSDLAEQRFSSTFTGREFFLSDHRVKGHKIMPGAAWLEMARAALAEATRTLPEGTAGIRLQNIVWLRPLAVGEGPVQVHIGLYPEENGAIAFKIYSMTAADPREPLIYVQGRAVLQERTAAPVHDLPAVRVQCSQSRLSSVQCYEAFQRGGIEYGPALRGIETLEAGDGKVLARLALPSIPDAPPDQFVLHPALLDSALQATSGLTPPDSAAAAQPALPFALDFLEIYGDCAAVRWALAGYDEDGPPGDVSRKINIDLCDAQGQVIVRMTGLTIRVWEEERWAGNNIPDGADRGRKPRVISGEPLTGTVMLAPVWDTVVLPQGPPFPDVTARPVIAGGDQTQRNALHSRFPAAHFLGIQPRDTVDLIAGYLEKAGSLDHIIYIASESVERSVVDSALIQAHNQDVFRMWRLIKAVLSMGYGSKELGWTVITTQAQSVRNGDFSNPAHAALQGLAGSMAKEYPNWKVRLFDLEAGCQWPFEEFLAVPAEPRGNPWVYRAREWYRSSLAPVEPSRNDRTSWFKTGGVYVVIGGAGGIGTAWSEYMIRTCQARIIWIGRREKGPWLQAQLEKLAGLGNAPQYIRADATDPVELERAYREIRAVHPRVNGVVHSALVLRDQSLAHMDEATFRAGFAAKAKISLSIAQVFQQEPLDFVLFFSSLNSFTQNAGQSNYVSGCTFQDAFARRLGAEWPCAVKTVNWGYWGSVGSVATPEYRERMAQSGIGSIEAPEAMAAVELLLSGPLAQIALLKTVKPLALEAINPEERLTVYPADPPADPPNHWSENCRFDKLRMDDSHELQEMDRLLARLLRSQLASLGVFNHKPLKLSKLKLQAGMDRRYFRWLEESLAVLTRHQLLEFDGECWSVTDAAVADGGVQWAEWERQRERWINNPHLKAEVLLVETTLRALPEILTGKILATDVIFPNSSLELVAAIYKDNPVADYFNEALADTLLAYLEQRLRVDPSGPVRILEIGAGTGGTSAMIFRKIAPYREHLSEYCYTDLSQAFLRHAQKEYSPDNPYLTYQIFNVEEPVAGQGLTPGGFDIVIAANVLHATRNIRNSLRNAKALLKSHGLLLLNEIGGNFLFSHLTFGLLEGWWQYEDLALRIPGCPALSPPTWQAVLEGEGFRAVCFPVRDSHELGQQIIAAVSDGVVRQKRIGVIQPPQALEAAVASNRSDEIRPSLKQAGGGAADLLKAKSREYITKLVGEVLQIPAYKIDAAAPLEKYGIDSLLATQLTDRLGKAFPGISSTLFFEYQTIEAIVAHLWDTRKQELMTQAGWVEQQAVQEVAGRDEAAVTAPAVPPRSFTLQRRPFLASRGPQSGSQKAGQERDIAVIGLTGRYPGARDIGEFWNNLQEGKDCVTEIPPERWDYSLYFDPDKNKPGKTCCKWGGFLEEVDRFDPLFFNIAPQDAAIMDPQERLFLETVWQLFESTGYTRASLQQICQGRVGVFAGAMYQNYHCFNAGLIQESAVALSSFSAIANRVSYFFNFQGPSIAVDTACSASAIAIHMACESLRKGECRMAVAGGVNLSLHPKKYIGLSLSQLLGSRKDSRSFNDGDGFLPAEGVGAALLKPLNQAIADRDTILAVIKSTATNHGGHTNGYSVPNPNAQAQLIEANFRQSGINPRMISYVEAAASGSALGDPIEINALTKAFQNFTADRQFCAIGSVKSNIGHPEAVSGIAQLTKVILQLQHRKLAPAIKAERLNPKINFGSTPFYLQKKLEEWRRPVMLIDGIEQEIPRYATVSSFGAGGSNAHLIVAEYIPAPAETGPRQAAGPDSPDGARQIAVFSARNQERLRAVAAQMLAFIESQPETKFADLIYTLQAGREAMEARLAMVVCDRRELMQGLQAYLNPETANRRAAADFPYFSGDLGTDQSDIQGLLAGTTGESFREILLAEHNPEKLALYWVRGGDIPWDKLHPDREARRIALPTYPFERQRCWVASAGEEPVTVGTDTATPAGGAAIRAEPDVLGKRIARRVGELLTIPAEQLPTRKPLRSLGFNSVRAVALRHLLEQDLGCEIPLAVVNDANTIENIVDGLPALVRRTFSESSIPEEQVSQQPVEHPDARELPEFLPQILANPAERYQPFALSDIQESYLTGRKLRFGGDAVGCHIYLEIDRDQLDIYRLNRAWERLIGYHEMLRAVILADGRQKILEHTPSYQFKIVDLRLKDEPERLEYLEDLRRKMSHKVYATEQWPLFEIRVSVYPGPKYRIHFSIDEFILDASGIYLLLRQWRQLYDEPDFPLPQLTVSFRDYLLAVKQFETSRRYRQDLEYWVAKLTGMPDGPRFASSPAEGGGTEHRTRLYGKLTRRQWDSLQQKAEQLEVSATVLFLGLFCETLRVWNSQERFSLILTFFNRPPLHPQLNQIVGPFISTNIFVVEKAESDSLEELIRGHQQSLWRDLDHSNVSGIRVLRELKARRKAANSLFLPVVFTSLLNLENAGAAGAESFADRITYSVTQTPQVYLDHQVMEQNGELMYTWDVAEAYFAPEAIRSLFEAYGRVIQALAADGTPWTRAALAAITEECRTAMQLALPAGLKLTAATADRLQPFPLTDQQQAYAFGRSAYLTGGNDSCQVYQEIEVESFDLPRMEAAWRKLLQTHEMLITVIRANGTQQLLEQVPDFNIPVANLAGKTAAEIAAALDAIRREMMARVFPLDQWPYFDLRVSLLDGGTARIHLTVDMLIADGRSIETITKQLFDCYADPEAEPEKPGLTFRDYVCSLRQYQKTAGYRHSLQYWERKFAAIEPGPRLPLNGSPPGQAALEREQYRGALANWESLKAAAAKLNVAPGMILLTVYAEVIAAWSGRIPFSIVIPSWERLPLTADISGVVGDFTAMSWVVIRDDPASFAAKVRRNHQTVQEDMAHMAVSGLKALRKVLMKHPDQALTFPVVFTDLVRRSALPSTQEYRLIKLMSKTPRVYLDNMSEAADRLYFNWDVVKGIYPEGLMAEMIAGYQRVLEALGHEPRHWETLDLEQLIDAHPEKYQKLYARG
jgi:acyl transferase domain-containing protein/non-ribosomal peptide synthetase component F/SAM-dependent methyltransferase